MASYKHWKWGQMLEEVGISFDHDNDNLECNCGESWRPGDGQGVEGYGLPDFERYWAASWWKCPAGCHDGIDAQIPMDPEDINL